jgi:type III pantothenate kinase
MLLTLDVGNTNLAAGLFDGEQLIGHWRLTTDRHRTSDELRLTTRGFLDEAGVAPSEIVGVAVASVVPALNEPIRRGLPPPLDGDVRFLTSDTAPIRLDVDEPATVGADRIANAVAGHTLHGGPLLVVDFGTAINFDLVSEDGAFLGGAIAPEMEQAARTVIEAADQLRPVELDVPDTVIGKTTATNLQAGVVLGYLDLVNGLIGRFKREYSRNLRTVATGGKGKLFHRHLNAIELYNPFLTLKGLRICWEKWR